MDAAASSFYSAVSIHAPARGATTAADRVIRATL